MFNSLVMSGPPSLYARMLKGIARVLFKLLLGKADLPMDITRRRLNSLGLFSRDLKGVKKESVQIGEINAEWLIADDAYKTGRVILYLHGGGYVSGSIQSHRELAGRIARASQARCLIIDYRLAPECPYPAQLEDSIEVWQWLTDQGVAANKIVLAGDSAGGGLALAMCLKLKELGLAQPAGVYCMSPWTDITLSGSSVVSRRAFEVVLSNPEVLKVAADSYAVNHDRASPLISPLFADFQDFPPILIHVGTEEVLLDDALRFHAKAIRSGANCRLKVWVGMWHVWQLFASFGVVEARQSIQEAGDFITNVIDKSGRLVSGDTSTIAT